jgi:lipopolysaccharide transport system permease protein
VVLGGLVDLAIAMVLMLGIAIGYGVYPGIEVLTLPLFVALGVVIVFGVGLFLSSVSVLYRDLRYVVPFGVQLWLFLTPVVYPAGEVDSSIRWLYSLNPMVGVVEGFRWAALGTGNQLATALPFSIVGAAVILLGGCWAFRKLEPLFADVV